MRNEPRRLPLLSSLICSLFLAQSAALAQQANERFAASFGESAVTWTEFFEELARRHRGKSLGKESLEHLIEKYIVEAEAEKRGAKISEAEVDSYLATLEKQLASQKRSLREHLAKRATSMKAFREYLALSRLYERLAREDLGLDAKTPLDAGRRRLWVTELKRKHAVVLDLAKLPQDAAALIGKRRIPLSELGRAMARNLVAEERYAILRQMVAYRLLQREAAARKIEISEADYDRALQRKRDEIAANPQYKKNGIDLERLLQAQGRSVSDLRRGEVFRADILLGAIGKRRFPDAELTALYEKDREGWEKRVGRAREAHRVLLRVGKNARDEKKALEDAALLRTRLKKPRDFAAAARRFSEDETGRGRGGRLGWLHREEDGVEETLLRAVFETELGKISQPVRDGQGVSLLLVTQERRGPTGGKRLAAIRRRKMATWLRKLVAEAKIEFHGMPRS